MFGRTFPFLLFYFTNAIGSDWPRDIGPKLSEGDVYDFIVVGAGSAGSTITGRLVERGQKVLVLEAGGKPPLSTVVPGLALTNFMSDVDWQFISEYDGRACQSLLDERCRKPRGKVLGGSSAINLMAHVRGNKIDYDDWNITNWSSDEMFPYFKRLESIAGYDSLPAEIKQYHNGDGPIKVTFPNASAFQWQDHLINAYQQIGLPHNWDVNGQSQIGVTITQSAIHNGERQSAAKAYLVPNSKKSNLNVAYNSHVTKIILNERNVATGVRVNIAGKKEIMVRARKEIIVSAGAINTPQILMLSGIGPESELKKHGIRVRVNNPYVGQNLHDHPLTPIVTTANTGIAPSVPANYSKVLLNQWLKDHSGLYTTVMGCDVSAFVDTAQGSSVPDIQFMHLIIQRNDKSATSVLSKIYGFNNDIRRDIEELNKFSEVIIFMPAVLRPVSRGSIHLASSNPFEHPLIDGNTLVEGEDYETYLRGIRFFEKLLTTETFVKNGVELTKIKSLYECHDFEFRSDDYWLCYHKNLADTIYHPVATASMGLVLDPWLRVYGVDGLRVADASAMPIVPRGNTNTPIIALAERAADLISSDYGF